MGDECKHAKHESSILCLSSLHASIFLLAKAPRSIYPFMPGRHIPESLNSAFPGSTWVGTPASSTSRAWGRCQEPSWEPGELSHLPAAFSPCPGSTLLLLSPGLCLPPPTSLVCSQALSLHLVVHLLLNL